MSRTLRPSGLTVLGILQLVFGGFQILGVLFSLLSFGCTIQVQGEAIAEPTVVKMAGILFNTGIAAALVVSGIGSLKVRSAGGRWGANLYVLLVAARTVVLTLLGGGLGGGVSMFTIASLVYPVLVLFFYNVVFADLWRPERTAPAAAPTAGRREAGSHILLIAGHTVKQTLRSAAGIILVLAVLAFGLFAAQVLLLPVEFVTNRAAQFGDTADEAEMMSRLETGIVPLLGRILSNVTGEPKENFGELFSGRFAVPEAGDPLEEASRARWWADFLIREKPGFLSLLFLLYCFIIPFLVIFSGFNQISGDARNRGLRYLLMRTHRKSIYFGKFTGAAVVGVLALAVLFLAVILYVRFKFDFYAVYSTVRWGIRGFVSFILVSLPYLAAAILFSGMINSGIASLGAVFGALVVYPLFVRLLAGVWEPLTVLHYLIPYRASYYLFYPKEGPVLLAAAGMLGYTALYLGLGYMAFRKRDL
ncbi:MAG: ABC transporter permease [Spirochaetia bacterium]